MAQSVYKERTWRDVREAAGMWPVGWLLFLPGCGLEAAASVIENFSNSETKPSPFSFLLRPLKVVAGAIDSAGDKFAKWEALSICALATALAPSLLVGGKAAAALGFSWHGLVAGGQFLGMAGAALGGFGAAFAVYPLALFAGVCAMTGLMAAPLIVRDAPKIWRAWSDGVNETLRWRPRRNDPVDGPAPVISTPAPAPAPPPRPELPPLMKDFTAVTSTMKLQPAGERIRFLQSLRRKYPEEFADALRLEAHDPELRKTIQVNKPLSFRKKRRGLGLLPGGRL